ncbi:putative 3-beta-hydroxysteroid-Delta(8),Delta(7)-isomerase [Heterostelium album PN500]|uniref:Putative 3-beta-hydroxysteroid-Delta(8),Delta(7)-isomerase n=1 Tax=Heterostelium pallidum (strain ATCC 26659 / Pp 5 / PN500) TaxID=670386 RepID=D3BHC3_HETP5|nr:putative 3-beta-hydroxysteroid-Delta(8),Delta(7)-isomerase [Heterostelium album PN500]EFA79100.1 putative 3-beta-hydroxysteroid-Delta(8),Delta(7)-isomerase [Heterostelium album PN500]|eukprot:XP_020431222.1 putative 3-beta-hydroxysteroid-Delta(8),Delta(7)-isomerase [Heterostelium album PN500]
MYTFVPLAALTGICVLLALTVKKEKLVVFWLLWSGLIHIILEGSYGFFAHEVTEPSKVDFMVKMFEDVPMEKALDLHWYASLYSQYAKYDLRYAIADPMVVFFLLPRVGPRNCLFLVGVVGDLPIAYPSRPPNLPLLAPSSRNRLLLYHTIHLRKVG